MPANDYARAQIDLATKQEAAAALAKMGLTVSDLCRMALTKVANAKHLPFSMEIPNEETRQALEAVGRREGLHYAKDAGPCMLVVCGGSRRARRIKIPHRQYAPCGGRVG